MGIAFESERLAARHYEPGDAPEMFEIYREPDIFRWLGGGSPFTNVAEAETAIARQIERDSTGSPLGRWGIVIRETGQLIGTVLVLPLEETPEIEIGYMLGKPHWGHGYATEICRAAIDYGFRNLDVDHLCGVVFPENIASQRVLEKAGMTYRGMRPTFGSVLRYYTVDRPADIPYPNRGPLIMPKKIE